MKHKPSFVVCFFLQILASNYAFAYSQTAQSMTIVLSPNAVSFHADSSPGIYESQPIDLMVNSYYAEWSIYCEMVSPLNNQEGKHTIPSQRLFINTPYTPSSPDKTKGPGYETLEKPRMVAKGFFTGPTQVKAGTIRFSLLTRLEDKPGIYSGQIRFTYLTNP